MELGRPLVLRGRKTHRECLVVLLFTFVFKEVKPMAEGTVREKRDLVLPPGTYAYMQDVTKGVVKVYSGPTVINPTAQETAVIYEDKKASFSRCEQLEESLKKSPVTVEGYYCVLKNPAKNRVQPSEGTAQASADLDVGRKIVIAGPAMFALWPGQVAEVIRGHHLHSNQFLLARVYNEEEARKNWSKAVMKPATTTVDTTGMTPEQAKKAQEDADKKAKEATSQATTLAPPKDLTVGKLLIIKGTEVSFYIPPTGITVLSDGTDATGKPNYTREALTLERLEYAILIDENGEKRYAKGPTVVFPSPTERFMESRDDDGRQSRKFRAIELNELQGLHIKVIADYEEGGKKFHKGEELFITGKDTAIYYPREEHSAIKYDGKVKHFATAIPVGEGRYVLERMTGVINKTEGPAMLLPDPRTEVIVRRVLSDRQCNMWYPGNAEALAYNQSLRQIMASVPSTTGAIREGDVERGAKNFRSKGGEEKTRGMMLSANVASAAPALIADSSRVSKDQGYVGDEFSRSAGYTQPRSITLNTKYQGCPVVEVFTGYGVLVVSKKGERRFVKGPSTILLDYDESLEVLEMSTGKPKNTDNLLRTVYLRTENNQVTDVIRAETVDHVQVEMKLSYRVNFEGDPLKWFSVENYVKYLCDHIRSVLKGFIKKSSIKEFYSNSTDLLREWALGKDHKGMMFEANGMRVTDVEVLGVTVADSNIRSLIDNSQTEVVRADIELETMNRRLHITREQEHIAQEEAEVKADTTKLRLQLETDLAAASLAVTLAKLSNQLKAAQEEKITKAAAEAVADFTHDANLARTKRANEQQLELNQHAQDQEIEKLKAEAETTMQRFQAASGSFSEALLSLSHNETLVKVAESWGIQRIIGGDSVSDALQKVFAGSSIEGLVKKVASGIVPNGGVPDKKVTTGAQG